MAMVDGAAGQHGLCPALANEPGRGGFPRDGRVRAVGLAQQLDRAQQRGARRRAFEREGLEEGGRPAPDDGVAVATHNDERRDAQ